MRHHHRAVAHNPSLDVQKLVTKESNKLTGANEPVDGDDHDGNADGSDAEGDGGKKKKPPNMTRLLKSRLQKLVEKTDDEYVSFPLHV